MEESPHTTTAASTVLEEYHSEGSEDSGTRTAHDGSAKRRDMVHTMTGSVQVGSYAPHFVLPGPGFAPRSLSALKSGQVSLAAGIAW